MTEIKNARDAIKIAKEVLQEAGYLVPRIANVEYNDGEGIWEVRAYEGETNLYIEIDTDGEVLKFETE